MVYKDGKWRILADGHPVMGSGISGAEPIKELVKSDDKTVYGKMKAMVFSMEKIEIDQNLWIINLYAIL
jgi:hypothetical protein